MKSGASAHFLSMPAVPAPFPDPVHVTRPLLPPLDEYLARLRDVWQAQWLTNNGAQHQALERELAATLGTPHLSLIANGTLALLAACRAFGLEGEAVTTPFTFPATTHARHWAGLTPVFADIDPSTLTLDPRGRGIRHHAAHLRDRRRSCLWHRVRCGGAGTLAARRG